MMQRQRVKQQPPVTEQRPVMTLPRKAMTIPNITLSGEIQKTIGLF